MDVAAETIDGELIELQRARGLAKKGFACLPWLWAVNVWMWWPDFWARHTGGAAGSSGDAVLHAYARRSALCFIGWACLFLPWMLAFLVAGPSLLSPHVYEALDAYRIDLAALGVGL